MRYMKAKLRRAELLMKFNIQTSYSVQNSWRWLANYSDLIFFIRYFFLFSFASLTLTHNSMIFPLKAYFDLPLRSFTDVKYHEIIFFCCFHRWYFEIVTFYIAVTAEYALLICQQMNALCGYKNEPEILRSRLNAFSTVFRFSLKHLGGWSA